MISATSLINNNNVHGAVLTTSLTPVCGCDSRSWTMLRLARRSGTVQTQHSLAALAAGRRWKSALCASARRREFRAAPAAPLVTRRGQSAWHLRVAWARATAFGPPVRPPARAQLRPTGTVAEATRRSSTRAFRPPRDDRTAPYEDEEEDLRFSGLTGGQLVHEALVECGVQHVFGYSGGANLPILDQFHKSPITFVMNRSEQCCGHAAEGYARASGRVGVVLTT
eukprot:scaffold4504_cov116-Isochrysis_galbana.AAC.6